MTLMIQADASTNSASLPTLICSDSKVAGGGAGLTPTGKVTDLGNGRATLSQQD